MILLVVVGLSVPALADPSVATPLLVDINGAGGGPPLPGWNDWAFGWNWASPQAATFDGVSTTLAVIRHDGVATGDARNRSGGFAHVKRTLANNNIGGDALCLYLDSLTPGKTYQISVWSLEKKSIWSNKPTTIKTAAWMQFPNAGDANECVIDWLVANGYPDGYDPCAGIPAGLAALLAAYGDETSVVGPESDTLNIGTWLGRSTFNITADDYGYATICGWLNVNELEGSFHLPLNGFMVIPEPATMALLGLGGLALLRRKRA